MNDQDIITSSRLPVEFTADQIKKLEQKTPPEMVKEVQKGGGKYKYVPHSYFTERLNDIFGYKWTFEIKEWKVWETATKVVRTTKRNAPILNTEEQKRLGKTFHELTEYEEEVVMVPDQVTVIGRLQVMLGDGIVIRKEQVGTAHVKKYKADHAKYPNMAIDIGNDIKSAASDAKKKCASELGMCLDVYAPILDEYYNQEEKRQTVEDMESLNIAIDLCTSSEDLNKLKPEIAESMKDMDSAQRQTILDKCVSKANSFDDKQPKKKNQQDTLI